MGLSTSPSDALLSARECNPHRLEPVVIRPEWIREGTPRARSRIVARTTDDLAFTALWDCSAGRFEWFYDFDETICVLEGGIVLTSAAGERTVLGAGDTFHFPAGSHFEWIVPDYVLKVAFVHEPLPEKLLRARRFYQAVKRWARPAGLRALLTGAPLAPGPATLAGRRSL